jgi:hypothetical protein
MEAEVVFETEAATAKAEQIEGKRLQCSKCNKKAMKDGKGLCWEHGERKRCEHPDCTKLAQRKGLCWEHGVRKRCEHADCTKFAKRKGFCDEHMKVLGLMRPKCKSPGCTKKPVKGGVCIAHGAKRVCMIVRCNRGQFKGNKCRYHYRCSLGDSGSDWDPSITRVMGMVGCEVLACLGMTNRNGEISVSQWDDVFAISGVCQSWREASIDYLNLIKPKVGLVPSQGFHDKKLDVQGFLDYLSEDERFALAETIYVPCGNADKLFYDDVKARLPAMTKLIHKTWLLVNGKVEYVVQGKGRHPCYRVYKHDHKYIEGETAWIKYTWDGKYDKVDEEQLVQELVQGKRKTKRTNFYRG